MTDSSRTAKQQVPPREWFEENFVHDGTVEYCSVCRAIPFMFIGHECTSAFYGIGGKRITVPYRWEDVEPCENDDRPDDWKLVYVGDPDA